jgi:AraC-like DNA-binding protein
MKLLRCSYGEFTNQQVIGPIIWSFFDLLVIHQGQVEITIANKKTYKLFRGEALLIYPNTHFSGKVLSETSLASVQHFALNLAGNEDKQSYPSFFNDLNDGAKYYSLDNLLIGDIERSLAYNQTLLPAAYVGQMQLSLLHLILGQLAYRKHNVLYNSRYKNSFNQLVECYALNPEQSLKVENMAAQVNLSQSHFRAEFVKLYGEPPKRYFLRLKMKAACKLLSQGQLPIKSISATLGYEDVSYFYRHFKKIVKTTPILYRQKKRIIG